jgi:hypothetical protein
MNVQRSRTPLGGLVFALAMAFALATPALAAEEPPLPEGLGTAPAEPAETEPGTDEPALPEGLGGGDGPAAGAGEPSLPDGLGDGGEAGPDEPALPEGIAAPPEEEAPAEAPEEREGEPFELPFDLTGFWEVRGGLRLQDSPLADDASIGETRLQLDAEKAFERLTLHLTTDLIYDPVLNEPGIDLEEGRGWLDLREAWVMARPTGWMDVKAGRQILTWGTGDLLFLNDLFPKDFVSFFIGRDTEYLKAPSDALKVSLFSDLANLDLVYMPRFDADRFLRGERLSYWSPLLGRRAGRDAIIDPIDRDRCFKDDEVAARLYRMVKGVELAAYGYHGYWKGPVGFDPTAGRALFPRLAVYGASVRAPLGPGIGNVEFAYYDSLEDRSGNNPFVPNSEWRLLVGYEQEIAKELTAGVQYYVEVLRDFRAFETARPAGAPDRQRERHLVTLRLTQLLMNQNLELSLFTFYSPSDQDTYLRPRASYKVTDRWKVEAGANVFFGRRDDTFFGQFARNTNFYLAARYSF